MAKFKVKNLISNQTGKTPVTDSNLVNSWGILTKSGKLWVVDNGTGVLTHYDFSGNPAVPPTVKLIDPNNPTSIDAPDGIIVNTTQGFVVANGSLRAASLFLISTENGNIYGYNPIVDQNNGYLVVRNTTGAVYKGLTILDNRLYAADFFNNRIDVFDLNFIKLSGFSFFDPDLPPHYAPFNIVTIDKHLYVSYALQLPPDNHDDQAGAGNGFINVFKTDGTFVKRLVTRGHLNSPWAMIVAPSEFGKYKHKLLVGNFGDGKINVYNFDGKHLATLKHSEKKTIVIDGLWGLVAVGKESVFFASGPDDEANGLVGKIIPEKD